MENLMAGTVATATDLYRKAAGFVVTELTPRNVKEAVEAYRAERSGLDLRRAYLGMSQIGKCAIEQYQRFVGPWAEKATNEMKRMCYEGYLHERDLLECLIGIGIARRFEGDLVAPFDDRFKGHPDGELFTRNGNGHVMLLEIKSVTLPKFLDVKRVGRIRRDHYEQVQCYMRYGGYSHCMVLVKCRETGELWCVQVTENRTVQEQLELRAMAVLAAVDAGQEPVCTCGRH